MQGVSQPVAADPLATPESGVRNFLFIGALACASLLVVANANAAVITVNGDSVKFTYDDASLYGTGNVIGNTIFFTPSDFKAESLDGAGLIQTSESLAVTVETLGSNVIESFQVYESGDYKIFGAGASVSAIGELAVDSQTSAYSDSVAFSAGALTTQTALTDWSAGAALDLADTVGWETDTQVIMTLSNTLSATSLNAGVGETAFIEKKFYGSAIGITIDTMPPSSIVPVPAAAWLFGSALGLLGWLRRRA